MADPIRQSVLTTGQPNAIVCPFVVNFSDASPKALAIVPKGYAVRKVAVKVKTQFGAGPTVDIGTATTPNQLMPTATVAPNVLGYKELNILDDSFAADTEIIATIAGGPVAGQLVGYLECIPEFDKAF